MTRGALESPGEKFGEKLGDKLSEMLTGAQPERGKSPQRRSRRSAS